MQEVVLVIERLIKKAPLIFRSTSQFDIEPAPAVEADLAEEIIVRNCRAVVLGTGTYRGPLYEALGQTGGGIKNRAIIARFGVGHDDLDKALAAKYGIVVTNAPGAGSQSVAEYAVCLMCCLARNVVAKNEEMKAGYFVPGMGVQIRGKTLGIIGFGNIGRLVAAIASFGFGMRVLAADCRLPMELQAKPGCSNSVDSSCVLAGLGIDLFTHDIDSVLKESDFISLHLPADENNRNIIDASRLALFKPGSMLINTSRGSILDEVALFDVLKAGLLAGAALDVYRTEPYVPAVGGKDLRTLENVILTPHIGSNTPEASIATAKSCLKNIDAFFHGRLEELDRVNDCGRTVS